MQRIFLRASAMHYTKKPGERPNIRLI